MNFIDDIIWCVLIVCLVCIVACGSDTKNPEEPKCKILLETDKQIVYSYFDVWDDLPKFKKMIESNNYTIQSVDSRHGAYGIITLNKNTQIVESTTTKE